MLPAGALAGLGEGALLAILRDPSAPTAGKALQPPPGTLGFARLSLVEANRSLLEPIAWQGWAAPAPQSLPAGSWARLAQNPPSFALRVSIDRPECQPDCAGTRALAQLQRNGVPGVDVRWVGEADDPEARLRATDAGVRLTLPGEALATAARWGLAAPREGDTLGVDILAQRTAAACTASHARATCCALPRAWR